MAKLSIHRRIQKALPTHWQQLQPHRELRREILRDLKGTLYPGHINTSYNTLPNKNNLNLTQQHATSLVMSLAAERPRVMITAKHPKHDAFARKMQRAINRYSALLDLELTLQKVALDAFTSMGVAKVYMADSIAVGMESSYRMDPGKPFVQRVCLDNLVYDTTASCLEEATFFADRYRVSHEAIMTDSRFKKWRKELENLIAEPDKDSERPTHLDGITDTVWLCDVYVPESRMVYTYITDRSFEISLPEPIAKMRWEGEDCGPYYFLNLGEVPDEIFPSSPAQNTRLLQQLVNSIYRKLEDQARRQKTVFLGPVGQEKDMEIIRDAQDGEYIPITGGSEAIKSIRLDGPDSNLMGYYLNALQQFSRSAGNLDHKMGLSPSSGTVGQEEMIGANVSRTEGQIQQTWVGFVRKVMKGVGRLLWNDGFTIIQGMDKVPGTNYSVPDDWVGSIEPGSRQGSFDDFEFSVDPYSMAYKSPQEKLGFLQSQWQQMMAAAPILMQLGVQPDAKAYYEAVERLSACPEIGKIAKFEQDPMAPQTGGSSQPGGPHEYIHRGAGPQGQNPEQEALSLMQASGQRGEQ